MTEADKVAAIIAAIKAAIEPASAYEYDKVPGSNGNDGPEPSKYVTVGLNRRYVDSRRASGEVSVPGDRLTNRYVAKRIADARNMRRLVTDLLEDKILTTGAGELGPFTFESADLVRQDEDYFVAEDTWTF